MEMKTFVEKALAIKAAEGYSRQLCFELPIGTKFFNSWRAFNYPDEMTPDKQYILDTTAKIKLSDIELTGVSGYPIMKCHKKGKKPAQPGTGYGYWARNGYLTATWEHLWKQKAVREVMIAWVNRATPNFSVSKDKGVILFENNKTHEKLRCDLTNQQFSRSYIKGKDRVIRYPAQFFKYVSGRVLVGLIKDEQCKTFSTLVGLVAKRYSLCRNFGTFLVRMFDHQHLEQYIAAGVEFDFDIPFNYTDFSKDIRAKLNENGIRYTQDVGSLFCSEIDTGRAVFAQIKDKPGFKNMVRILAHNIQPLNTLCNHYNYDLKTLFAYCRARNWKSRRYNYYYGRDNQPDINPEETTEEIALGYYGANNYDCISYLRDYARMALDVHGEAYEKYPANLPEAHGAVDTLHRARVYQVNAQQFEATIDSKLEWKNKEFAIVYPKTPEEIIEEGKKLRHCVGSYIQSVIRGECKILFLRKKEEIDKPFVTIELSGGNIRQARGFGNANPIYDARMALQDYAKEKKLLYRGN